MDKLKRINSILLADLACGLRRYSRLNIDQFKGLVLTASDPPNQATLRMNQVFRDIKKKMKDEDSVIVKADKGCSLSILKLTDYK